MNSVIDDMVAKNRRRQWAGNKVLINVGLILIPNDSNLTEHIRIAS